MPRLPRDLGSDDVIRALRKLGFVKGVIKGSSHQSYVRTLENGHHVTVPIVLGQKEIPTGTLRGIIRLSGFTVKQFLDALKD